MRYDVRCGNCKKLFEVVKRMADPLPRCSCGGTVKRVFGAAPAVHYLAGGFYSTDVAHFEKQVGPERAARFRAQKADIEKRAANGRLTKYEKALE